MKNIIPFKKDIVFKTKISEITSISLENTLNIDDDIIKGDFIISGDYKISDNSTTVEPFDITIPFEISIDDRYDCKRALVDIDDFYYEIVDNNVLSISIDVLLDKLQEKPLMELTDMRVPIDVLESEDDTLVDDIKLEDSKSLEEKEEIVEEEVKETNIQNEVEDVKEERKEEVVTTTDEVKEEFVEEKINSLFNQFSKDSEVYVSYNVFILRDGDTLDSVMEKYNISLEELKKYNDLSNLQLGDKLIIPNTYERD